MWKRSKFALYVDKYVTMWPENTTELKMGTGCSSSHVIHTITYSTTFCFSTSIAAWMSSSLGSLWRSVTRFMPGFPVNLAAAGTAVQRLPWGRTGRRRVSWGILYVSLLFCIYCTHDGCCFNVKVGHRAHTCTNTHKTPWGWRIRCFRTDNPCMQWRAVHFLLHPQRARG